MPVRKLGKVLGYVLNHPLNRDRRLSALRGFVRWQVGSRLVPGAVVIPFVNGSRLIVERNMTVGTGNVYTGLKEFEEMSFVLHALRPDDLFVDVGANVGTYTVIAGAGVGARTVSIEPDPAAFEHLLDNVRLNRIEDRVRTCHVAAARGAGTVRFSMKGLHAISHVLAEGEATDGAGAIEVPTMPLDEILGDAEPVVMKIDVEGFETEVVAGGRRTLERPSLLALIMETSGHGSRYGFDEAALHEQILALGFEPCDYVPWERRLVASDATGTMQRNALFVRDRAAIEERLRTAPPFTVRGRKI